MSETICADLRILLATTSATEKGEKEQSKKGSRQSTAKAPFRGISTVAKSTAEEGGILNLQDLQERGDSPSLELRLAAHFLIVLIGRSVPVVRESLQCIKDLMSANQRQVGRLLCEMGAVPVLLLSLAFKELVSDS